jgi:hypothetical protein
VRRVYSPNEQHWIATRSTAAAAYGINSSVPVTVGRKWRELSDRLLLGTTSPAVCIVYHLANQSDVAPQLSRLSLNIVIAI